MKVSFEEQRILIDDRTYERPVFGVVAFPEDSPSGYVLIMGELARPIPEEADGLVETPDVEPFRSIHEEEDTEERWLYSEDVVLEVIAEAVPVNLRALEEKICDFSQQFRTPHFFCSPEYKDAAFKSCGTLYDIINRRFANRPIWRKSYQDVPGIAPINITASRASKYCEGIVRSLVAMKRLLFNADCRHVLSQSPLALKALGVGCFVGTTYHLRIAEPLPDDWVPDCETYQ